jgi:drug/metabolite transporter (DMT)-like permease
MHTGRAGHVPTKAVLLILGSVLCFTLLDTIVKHLAPHYPIPLLVWARLTFQAGAMLIWLGPTMKLNLLRTPRVGMQTARGILIVASSFLFMSALKYLPLAEATAISYSSPVLVVLMAVLFLDEQLSAPRVAFVIAGVVGMLMIVRPGADIFNGATVLALSAACVYATYQILTRKVAAEDPRVTLFYPGVVGAIVMTAVLPFVDIKTQMPLVDILLVCAAGLLGTLGHLLFILAFQRGPASALIPFTYMQLVWATLIGWLVFQDFPDRWALSGMAVIAGSGLLIALYERRTTPLRKARLAAADPAID